MRRQRPVRAASAPEQPTEQPVHHQRPARPSTRHSHAPRSRRGARRCSALRVDSAEEAESLSAAAGIVQRRELAAPPIASIDPESDDAEAWECECIDEFTALCEDQDQKECFRGLFCQSRFVSLEWKNESHGGECH